MVNSSRSSYFSRISRRTALIASDLSDFLAIVNASSILDEKSASSSDKNLGVSSSFSIIQSSTPTISLNSLILSITICIDLWPNNTAPSMRSSFSSFASDSTIRTASDVPATTISRKD